MKHELEQLIATIKKNHGLDISLYDEAQAILNRPKLYTIKAKFQHLYPKLNGWVGTAKMFIDSEVSIGHIRPVELQSEMEAFLQTTDMEEAKVIVTYLLNILYASQQ